MSNTLKKLEKQTATTFCSASTIWPFAFNRNKVSVDKKKVVLTYSFMGFMSKKTFPIPLSDILTVKQINSVLFSTLKFEIQGYEKNPKPLTYLSKSAAKNVREILLGMLIAKKEGVQLNNSSKKAAKKLKKIGS
jgi:hypothetical protein